MPKCRVCRNQFVRSRPLQPACSFDCELELANRNVAKAQAKRARLETARARTERKADRAKRETMKPLRKLLGEAQKAFNDFIRARDAKQPCICCGRKETAVDGLGSHGWDAGHYRSTGSASHLRFDESNVHRQLVFCNRHGAGRAVDYRVGLIARIGLAEVERLESSNEPRKWTREELIGIKATYRAKLREMVKQTVLEAA
jgi:hypothetical protein